MKNLRTIYSIKEEISVLQDCLEGLPEELQEDFVFLAYKRRLEAVKEELYYANLYLETQGNTNNLLDIRLKTKEFQDNHEIPATFLGPFLESWQNLIDALGQVVIGKVTKKGMIQREITQNTKLNIRAFAPGSFVIKMSLESTPQESQKVLFLDSEIAVRAFELFEEVVDAGAHEESILLLLEKLKLRATSRYLKILDLLSNYDIEFSAGILSPHIRNKISYVSLSRHSVKKIKQTIESVQKKIEKKAKEVEEHFFGRFTGANLRNKTFEFESLDEEEGAKLPSIVGKVSDEKLQLLEGCTIGSTYNFTVKGKINQYYGVEYELVNIYKDIF